MDPIKSSAKGVESEKIPRGKYCNFDEYKEAVEPCPYQVLARHDAFGTMSPHCSAFDVLRLIQLGDNEKLRKLSRCMAWYGIRT